MSDDLITITVDGRELSASKGQMLIEVTDQAGIDIPRFCYHKKLSIAANCRMCLVEVEKAPKPLPACATPVMPDMVVHTRSELARSAQKGTMEFLLINHPLDCPICDQGGECELQDVALGYGESSSAYTEGKRVVIDKYLGPLISTEMTRCIHCTRCVRFGEEIAGLRELGATGRGENVRIGTYIEKSVVSEVSGNVIDICPVGALTAKPSRFTARAWELSQHAGISPHDCLGSNVFIHTEKGTVNRVVPRENEQINEVWIADRDRFSYQGLNSADRLVVPKLRVDGELVDTDWDTALQFVAKRLTKAQDQLATLVSPYATLEEMFLAQKLTRALGACDIDHRLGQQDFSDQARAPVMPWLGMDIPALESLDAVLLIGANVRKEQPLAALRLRKVAMNGGSVSLMNTSKAPVHFDPLENLSLAPPQMLPALASLAHEAGVDGEVLMNIAQDSDDAYARIAASLSKSEHSAIVLGSQAVTSPEFAAIRALAAAIATATGSVLAYLPEAGNTCGAWLSGCVPHRGPGGEALESVGRDAHALLSTASDTLLLLNVEPELDAADPSAVTAALEDSGAVIAISSYLGGSVATHADVVLPLGVFTETAGTYVNASGRWQFTKGVPEPLGQARPGWKIMAALGALCDLEGFEYASVTAVSAELQQLCQDVQLDNSYTVPGAVEVRPNGATLYLIGENTLYSGDPVVRRATALQKTRDARVNARVGAETARRFGLAEGDRVSLRYNGTGSAELPVVLDDAIPDQCVWVPRGVSESANLGPLNAPIDMEKV
ncbi:MAG TPA: NADH-quinone oxidoreductase subunit G [Gammaproteobacteria bacterium]|nr:NADH-quinone oxidoreductase subunit G [Gammaproteobacteria bacterium]